MFCATQAHHVYSELDKNLHTVSRSTAGTFMSAEPGCLGGVRVLGMTLL